jgi:hypothetical protein
MATLYWGNNNGTWDGFTTGNWFTDFDRLVPSTRAPSAEDDVIFDSNSWPSNYVVTIANNTTVCRNISITGGSVTFAGTGTWNIYGNLILPSGGFTRTYTGNITFYGTGSQTITTNGVTFASSFTFSGIGTYTLQDALNIGTAALQINSGTLVTNNNNLTCGNIIATTGTTAGTLTLGSSTVSAASIASNAPLVINGGTSNITLTGSNGVNIGGGTNYTGSTFYNVTFSSATISNCNFYGNNIFNNLTFAAKSTVTVSPIVLYGNQTVTGTLTIAGQLSVRRYFIQSNIVGTTRTLTVGTVASLVDVDFRDITVAGASSPWSGSQLGDCRGNTNITFPTARTIYWNNTAGGAWTGNFWATSSGGTVNVANFPLAQDTVYIDNTGLSGSITGIDQYNVGGLVSIKTTAYQLSGTGLYIYGTLSLTASTTVSGLQVIFAGRGTQNFTSAGNQINTVILNGFGGAVFLADNTTVTNLTITSGGLNTTNKSFTVTGTVTVSSTNTGPFTLTLGSSAVIFPSGGFSSSATTAPTMTVNAGTSTITIAGGSGLLGFVGQTLTWNNVTFSLATVAPFIYGNNTFNNLTFTAAVITGVNNILVYGNQTVTGTLAFGGGTSVTQRMAVFSDTAGTQRTLTVATVTGLSDIDFRDIAVVGASAPWSGTRLGNCLGNSGITFAAGVNKYWSLAGTQNWNATVWATSSGGTPSANNFPLAQDTAVFDDAVGATTVNLPAGYNVGGINASARTIALSLSQNNSFNMYGNFTLGSGVVSSSTGTISFFGVGTQTFDTANKSLSFSLNITRPSCVFQHASGCSTQGNISVTYGSYSTQNYNVNCAGFSSSNTNTRSINLGTSTVTLSGLNPVTFNISTGLTFTGSSSTINLSSTSAKTFAGGGQTFGTVSSTSGTSNPLTISGNNTFATLTNSARTNMIWTAGTTQTITNFTYSGASGSVVRWYTSIAGQKATLKGNSGAVGTNSTDGGNNTGLTFTGSSPNYFYVKDIAYSANYNGNSNFFSFF